MLFWQSETISDPSNHAIQPWTTKGAIVNLEGRRHCCWDCRVTCPGFSSYSSHTRIYSLANFFITLHYEHDCRQGTHTFTERSHCAIANGWSLVSLHNGDIHKHGMSEKLYINLFFIIRRFLSTHCQHLLKYPQYTCERRKDSKDVHGKT